VLFQLLNYHIEVKLSINNILIANRQLFDNLLQKKKSTFT